MVNMRTVRGLLLAAACLLGAQLAGSEPVKFTEDRIVIGSRLPVNVRPTKYDVHLTFKSLDSEDYEGSVEIEVDFMKRREDFLESKKATKMLADWNLSANIWAQSYLEDEIVMHADKSVEIQEIVVTTGPSLVSLSRGKQFRVTEGSRNEEKQMIAFKVDRGEYPTRFGGRGKVKINFTGRMRDDKRGVYLSTYSDGQQVFKHIVSQFQPTDARTVFPCFDEPRFKIPFSLRLTYPKGLTAYGNTDPERVTEEGDLATTVFATTPPMPVHMVAFTIGQFDKPLEVVSTGPKHGIKARKDRRIRVITAPGKRDTGGFALEVARRSLEWFEEYIDYDFPLKKLDVIAIADHDKDNTESWGLVFVRDNLVWIDDETKQDTRITTAVNIAHVVVHQWFGNLISASWWSDLWITEGVAAQFAFKFVQENYNFQSEFFVRLGPLSSVMQADQAGDLHSLSPVELQTSDQIYSIFDNLEFMKSGSMAQMVEEYVNSSSYREILQSLIKNRAYKTVNERDYERAVDSWPGARLQTGFVLPKILRSFKFYEGVPLITCQIRDGTAMVFVKAFADDNIKGPKFVKTQKVFIKANAVLDNGSPHFELTSLNTYGQTIYFPEWFDLEDPSSFIKIDQNPSIAAYYRARYDDQLYEHLQTQIKKRFIGPMDRLQILDDANNLVQAGLITQTRFKSLLDSYANEDHPAVVLAILTATNTYRGLAGEDVTSLPSDKAIWSIFKTYHFKVDGKEEAIMQRARQVVLTTLIQQGNKEVLDDALKAFVEARGDIALFLRQPVYTAVALSGSSAQVNQLLSHLSETKSYEEKIRLVTALTQSKDKEVLEKLKSWLESSGLKEETIKPFLDTISMTLSS